MHKLHPSPSVAGSLLLVMIAIVFCFTGCTTPGSSYADYGAGSDIRREKDARLNRETAVSDADEAQVARQRRILHDENQIEAEKQQANYNRVVSPLKTFHDAAEQVGFHFY